jgi:subtilase family serine protease
VQFIIKNTGTNATGSWRFSAVIPTETAYVYQSVPQQSLNPGESIEYTLGFDQAKAGANQTISINVNFDHSVAESDTTNNGASANITVLGS